MTAVSQLTFKGVNEEVLESGAVALSSSSELFSLPIQLARTSVLSGTLLILGQPTQRVPSNRGNKCVLSSGILSG